MRHPVKILNKKKLNHDVIQLHLKRPRGYQFNAGQAIELTLEKPERLGPSPFTFTGLNGAADLELTIKIYEEHGGLTAALSKLHAGDDVFITDPWDSFINKGAGVFIAGGAGVTPFIAMLRQMHADGSIGDSLLFFSNKTSDDIFLHDELKNMLQDHYIDILTRENNGSPERIDEALLHKHIKRTNQPFYVCGPPGFIDAIQHLLTKIGAREEAVNISL